MRREPWLEAESEERDMSETHNIKDYIQGKVRFSYYKKGDLYYLTENGFLFRVPIEDAGDAVFLPEDKGIYFMRYIRKELKGLENEDQYKEN